MDANRNIIYDKFLIIEGFAYRGKVMVERGSRERAIECHNRILMEMKELGVLLKQVTDGIEIAEKKDH
jgi:hypothetical protein